MRERKEQEYISRKLLPQDHDKQRWYDGRKEKEEKEQEYEQQP